MLDHVLTPVIVLNSLILVLLMIYYYFKDEIKYLQRFDHRFLKWPGDDVGRFIDSNDANYKKHYEKNKKFIQAGIKSNLYIKFFMIARFLSLAISALFIWYIIEIINLPLEPEIKYFLVALCSGIGFIFPDLDLRLRKNRRVYTFERNMPTLLNMMLVCLDSGLTFKTSLYQISKELESSHPVISRELARTYKTLDFLSNQRAALSELINRVPSPQIKRLSITILQSIQQGTSLRDSIANIADSANQETLFNLEKSAHNIPNILTALMVIFTLPVLFIVLFGPYYKDFGGLLHR